MLALQAAAVLMWLVAAGFGYGGGLFERFSPEVFGVLLGLFWAGFAVPFPPLIAIARLALLGVGWSALK